MRVDSDAKVVEIGKEKKEKVKYKHVGKEWNKEKKTCEIKRESDEWE